MKRSILFVVTLVGMIYFSGCASRIYVLNEDVIKAYNAQTDKNGNPQPLQVGNGISPSKLVIVDRNGKITEVDGRSSDFYAIDAQGNIVRYSGYSPYSPSYGGRYTTW